MDPAQCFAIGNQFPYDADDAWWNSDEVKAVKLSPPVDWAHAAARGVLADLQDRHTIKFGFLDLDQETRQSLVASLAEIIRIAAKKS